MTRNPAPRPLLVPREHGAYGQLGMALATALAIGGLTVASVALALAAVLAFVAHEALLVVLGQRGRRAREEDGRRAMRTLAVLGGAAAACGAVGLALAPPAARSGLVPPVLLTLFVAALVVRKLEKTAAGEMAVGAALSSSGLAVALAGGASREAAMAACFTWTIGFAMATMAVQAVLQRARAKGKEDRGPRKAVAIAGLLGVAIAVTLLAGFPRVVPLALAPTAALSIGICLARPAAKRLREMGWAMIGSSVVTLLVLVATLR